MIYCTRNDGGILSRVLAEFPAEFLDHRNDVQRLQTQIGLGRYNARL
jgi:hypothetical protein